MNNVLDTDLVARLKMREEEAFLCLYDSCHASVYRFLLYMSGSQATAEDLTQQVFTIVLDGLFCGKFERFDSERGTLEGYLLGIARNLQRVEIRRTRLLTSLESLLRSPRTERDIQSPEHDEAFWEGLVARAQSRQLRSAILKLPAHYREVIVLCGLEEQSYKHAARIIGCSEGTIASRANRAKALLARSLRDSGEPRPSSSTRGERSFRNERPAK